MAGAGWQKKNMKIKKRPFANSVGVKNQSLISLSIQTAKMCCAVKHLKLRYMNKIVFITLQYLFENGSMFYTMRNSISLDVSLRGSM